MIDRSTRMRTRTWLLFALILAAGCIPERLGPLPDTKVKEDTKKPDTAADRSVPPDVIDLVDLAPGDMSPDEVAPEVSDQSSKETADVEAVEDLELGGDTLDTSTDDQPAACGDGECKSGDDEDCDSCPEDCGICLACGDGICSASADSAENPDACPEDCGACGDGICGVHETADSCAFDCSVACGDGFCQPPETGSNEESDFYCPIDCGLCSDQVCGFKDLYDPDLLWCRSIDCKGECGDGFCNVDLEDAEWCAMDCALCGDGICSWFGFMEKVAEDCPQDCLTPCGDGVCDLGESPDPDSPHKCLYDCGPCGDGVCGHQDMNWVACKKDCGESCGNSECDGNENETTCPADCAECIVVCPPQWECGLDEHECGQYCGACSPEEICLDHFCCLPKCNEEGITCGVEGCEDECGKCLEGKSCVEGQCV